MPPKKRRGNKRKNGNRRRKQTRKGNYTTRENSGFTFLDPHRYITFKYVESFTATVAATAGTQQTMNLNSLFDPNRTGSGHQPYGFDQIAALYNRYRVLETRWKVIFGTYTGTFQCVVLPVNSLLVSAISDQATYQTACEMPKAKVRTQGGGGSPTVQISGSMKLWQLNGVTKIEYLADDRFEAAVGTSPTEIMTLVVGAFNPNAGSVTISYTVEMEFHTDMHDPISLSASFDNYQSAQKLKGMIKELSASKI